MFGRKKEKEVPSEEERQRTEEGLRKTRQTWFSRMTGIFRRGVVDEDLWDEMEEVLVSADVGVATTTELLERVRERVAQERRTSAEDALTILKEEMVDILEAAGDGDSGGEVRGRPTVVLVVGVNGTGKTTSIAKLSHWLVGQGRSVVLGAADTFRAAAVEQLQVWGQRLGVEVIAHQAGSDPGAVAHDAYQAAQRRDADVVVVDTAGRLHTKTNLMEELKKVARVVRRLDETAPHQVILVLDATTGQNGLLQARYFTEALGCTGVFLTKLDGTAKGGIVLAIARDLGLPVLFVGTGEGLEDMARFDPRGFVEALFSSEPQEAASPH